MSYYSKFKGKFVFDDYASLLNALKIIDEENENPDDFEMNSLEKSDFEIKKEENTLVIDFKGFIPASSWYGCHRVICKMSKDAIKGKIKCSFEGDPDEWVRAGHGWD